MKPPLIDAQLQDRSPLLHFIDRLEPVNGNVIICLKFDRGRRKTVWKFDVKIEEYAHWAIASRFFFQAMTGDVNFYLTH